MKTSNRYDCFTVYGLTVHLWARTVSWVRWGGAETWKACKGAVLPWERAMWRIGSVEWVPSYDSSPLLAILPLWLWAEGGSRTWRVGRGWLPRWKEDQEHPSKPTFLREHGTHFPILPDAENQRGVCEMPRFYAITSWLSSFGMELSSLFICLSLDLFCINLIWDFCFVLAMPNSLQDLSSPTRDWTWALAVKTLSPNHGAAREFPYIDLILKWARWNYQEGFW